MTDAEINDLRRENRELRAGLQMVVDHQKGLRPLSPEGQVILAHITELLK